MFCGQDKNKRTILMDEGPVEDICSITRFLATCLDAESAQEFRATVWRAFTYNGISRGEGKTKIYFKPVSKTVRLPTLRSQKIGIFGC